MKFTPKEVASLTPADLARAAVWQFVDDEAHYGETMVRPVLGRRVTHLRNRAVGTLVQLACGERVWALLGNVDLETPELNAHFLVAHFFRGGKRFNLARYHDTNWERSGPQALARFLGLSVDKVFPIRFDLRPVCRGAAAALCGEIPKEPLVRLSDSERVSLALGD